LGTPRTDVAQTEAAAASAYNTYLGNMKQAEAAAAYSTFSGDVRQAEAIPEAHHRPAVAFAAAYGQLGLLSVDGIMGTTSGYSSLSTARKGAQAGSRVRAKEAE
jgi:hypothetical protein